MKFFISSLILAALTSITFAADTAPGFSAFSSGKSLYVTILGDGCNHYYPSLTVSDYCKNDRMLGAHCTSTVSDHCKNEDDSSINGSVDHCEATLDITHTKMRCRKQESVPVILKINLDEEDIVAKAKVLHIKRRGYPEVSVILD